MSDVVKRKVLAVLIILICTAVLYAALLSGDVNMMWGALALMLVGCAYLFKVS